MKLKVENSRIYLLYNGKSLVECDDNESNLKIVDGMRKDSLKIIRKTGELTVGDFGKIMEDNNYKDIKNGKTN